MIVGTSMRTVYLSGYILEHSKHSIINIMVKAFKISTLSTIYICLTCHVIQKMTVDKREIKMVTYEFTN